MHRILRLSVLLALLLAVAPAKAETVNGTILLADYGSPAVARILYNEALVNGLIGYVLPVGAKNSFTLRKAASNSTGLVFDIFFYNDIGGEPGNLVGQAYNTCPGSDLFCDKAGAIPAGAKWAIVSMALGVNGSFVYQAS